MDDVDNFTYALHTYKVLPKRVVDQMDREYVQSHGAEVVEARPVYFAPYTDWCMGHVCAYGYKQAEGADTPVDKYLNTTVRIHEWGGATGWCSYIDRASDVYIAVTMRNHYTYNPIVAVVKDVYKAL